MSSDIFSRPVNVAVWRWSPGGAEHGACGRHRYLFDPNSLGKTGELEPDDGPEEPRADEESMSMPLRGVPGAEWRAHPGMAEGD